jgi:hypothetical protein
LIVFANQDVLTNATSKLIEAAKQQIHYAYGKVAYFSQKFNKILRYPFSHKGQ